MRRQGRLFDGFAAIVLTYPEEEVTALAGRFIQSLDPEDTRFVSEHFPMLILCGNMARQAPEQIKKELAASARPHGRPSGG